MGELEREAVTRQVKEILAEALGRQPAEIGLDDRLTEDLGAESVDLMTLVFEFEDTFGRTLEDEEIAALTTVRSVIELILSEPARER